MDSHGNKYFCIHTSCLFRERFHMIKNIFAFILLILLGRGFTLTQCWCFVLSDASCKLFVLELICLHCTLLSGVKFCVVIFWVFSPCNRIYDILNEMPTSGWKIPVCKNQFCTLFIFILHIWAVHLAKNIVFFSCFLIVDILLHWLGNSI